MPSAPIALALFLLCQCSGEGDVPPQKKQQVTDQKPPPATTTAVLQRDRDATEQLLLRSDGQLLRLRFDGSRVLDASHARLTTAQIRSFHQLTKSLAGSKPGKRDEEHMDGAEFTVQLAPGSKSTRHEDLLAAKLRQGLHDLFDTKHPAGDTEQGSWVRARDFATAMGLGPTEAKDVGAVLTKQKLVAIPAGKELAEALRWPGALIPGLAAKLPKARPGKPLIIQSAERYFVVDVWTFKRK